MRKYTLIFTLIGLALCLFHYTDVDKKNLLISAFSIPLWFIHAFYDVRNVDIVTIYFLTIASWTLLGYILDRLVQRSRADNL